MPDATPPPIVFGTDGWRARIADEFTYDTVRRCAQGVAEWVLAEGTGAQGVVVGYDRRFASEHFAARGSGGAARARPAGASSRPGRSRRR